MCTLNITPFEYPFGVAGKSCKYRHQPAKRNVRKILLAVKISIYRLALTFSNNLGTIASFERSFQ